MSDNRSLFSILFKDENQIHKIVVWILLVVMMVEWVLLLINLNWLPLFLVTLIILTLFAPIIFKKKIDVEIPAEFHLMAVIFIFAGLYLGEIHHFYERIWWWDIALHTTAGLMMGIIGFLLVYILNETSRIELNMKPGFIALFAFTFAVTIGTFWEIFEYSMDQIFGLNMQKPMWGDPSGLTDTMWDMIVNAIGAFVVSISGWWYLREGKDFYIRALIQKFINKNPDLFKRK